MFVEVEATKFTRYRNRGDNVFDGVETQGYRILISTSEDNMPCVLQAIGNRAFDSRPRKPINGQTRSVSVSVRGYDELGTVLHSLEDLGARIYYEGMSPPVRSDALFAMGLFDREIMTPNAGGPAIGSCARDAGGGMTEGGGCSSAPC